MEDMEFQRRSLDLSSLDDIPEVTTLRKHQLCGFIDNNLADLVQLYLYSFLICKV